MLVLGNTSEDIVRINAKFPLLAFFLGIISMNKRSRTVHSSFTTSTACVNLGPYGIIEKANAATSVSWSRYIGIASVHVLAGTGAAFIVWQTLDLGRKAVVSWACWTNGYLMVWLGLAVFHHVLTVVCMRLSLRCSRISDRKSAANRCALLVWDLTHESWLVECTHTEFSRWSKICADLLNNVTYVYATAVFSSLTLVTGHNAIKILAFYGGIVTFSRVAAAWLLQEIDGSE